MFLMLLTKKSFNVIFLFSTTYVNYANIAILSYFVYEMSMFLRFESILQHLYAVSDVKIKRFFKNYFYYLGSLIQISELPQIFLT